MRGRAWRVLLLAVLALLPSACDDSPAPPPTSGAVTVAPELVDPGVLTVAADVPNPPFAVRAAGRARGFDIDLVTTIARRLGIDEVRVVDRPRAAIPAEVAAGRVDLSAAAWVITPDRDRQVDFGDPYLSADQAVLVRRAVPVSRLDDLAGRRVGVVPGSAGADLAATVPGARIVPVGSAAAALAALGRGRIDATIGTYPSVAYAAARRPGLAVAVQIPGTLGLGLMFPPGAATLREAFDAGLAAIKADGTYDRIRDRWFAEPAAVTRPGQEGPSQ